jgi:hypothetical protein
MNIDAKKIIKVRIEVAIPLKTASSVPVELA